MAQSADATKRKPGAPLTEDEKKRIRELVAQEVSHSQICRELGIGSSTLSRFKAKEGLSTVPVNPTIVGATAGYKRDAAKKRTERQAVFDELFQLRAEAIRKVLRGEEKYKTLVKIPGGGEITESLSYIPAQDLRSEMSVLANLDQSINRNDDRADDGGLARAQSMLQMVLLAAAKGSFSVPAEEAVFED